MSIKRNYTKLLHIFSELFLFQRKRYLTYLIVGLICGYTLSPVLIKPSKNKSPNLHTNNILNNFTLKVGTGFHPHTKENRTIADDLFKGIRLLCWVMTFPETHMQRALHVKKTWGKRCNKLLFMSTVQDKILGTVALPLSDGRDTLWGKTKEAFKYIYKYHFDDYDWFLKADDDTYIIVENLRAMLYAYKTEYPVHFGFKFNNYIKHGYNSGGAGYVLSKEALKRFIEQALPNPDICRNDNLSEEDVEIGRCLENVGVVAADTRDEFGRGRFFAFTPRDHLLADPTKTDYWYWKNSYFKTDEGLDCCSHHTISFHYIEPHVMYLLDYFVYHLRPFGIKYTLDILPEKKLLDDVLKDGVIPSNNNITHD